MDQELCHKYTMSIMQLYESQSHASFHYVDGNNIMLNEVNQKEQNDLSHVEPKFTQGGSTNGQKATELEHYST